MRPLTLLLAASAASVIAGAAFAASDRAFLQTVVQTDNSEIQAGQLAEQKGASHEARDFGQMLVMDHTQHKMMVAPLARAHGVTDLNAVLPAAPAEMAKLQGLSGPAFDHEFARFMVKGHEQAISQFQQEVSGGQDPAVRKMARDTLPTLHKHLDAARRLARS